MLRTATYFHSLWITISLHISNVQYNASAKATLPHLSQLQFNSGEYLSNHTATHGRYYLDPTYHQWQGSSLPSSQWGIQLQNPIPGPYAVQTASGPEAEPKSKDRSALKRRAREAGPGIGQLRSKNVIPAKEKHRSDPIGTFWNTNCTTEAILPWGKWPSLLSTHASLFLSAVCSRYTGEHTAIADYI